MMNCIYKLLSLTIILALFFQIATAQISAGGQPMSFGATFQKRTPSPLPTTKLPAADIATAIKEDKASGRAFRFAIPIEVNYNLTNSGTWTELADGSRVWRLKIHSPQAHGLAVLYKDFFLPQGATLYMYSNDHQQIKGAYTHQNNKASGKFLTGLIHSDTAILEYYEPSAVKGQGSLQLYQVMHAYNKDNMTPSTSFRETGGFGASLDCHINVNCPQGDDWQAEKRSTVRIMIVVTAGMGWCSGTLINNANKDGKPYVLSAYHCQDGYIPVYDLYRFDFNYESSDCSNPSVEPNFQSILGCSNKSGRRESDFTLFEISSPIPLSYQPYFAGWNRTINYEPTGTRFIHHPNGDIKKISLDNDQASIYPNGINWSNNVSTPANHHLLLYMDEGTFEGGSSGSALFDNNGHVVGQLNGGNAHCDAFEAFFGRFSLSWDSGGNSTNQLQDWLDPNNEGMQILDSYDPLNDIALSSIAGNIYTTDFKAILLTKVYLYANNPVSEQVMPLDSVFVDADGSYSFEFLPQDKTYYVVPKKDIMDGNGVSTFDIILTQQYVLGFGEFDNPYKYLAADLNQSGDISTFDIVQMRQLILSFISNLPDVTSWKFANPTFVFADPMDPFASLQNQQLGVIHIPNLTSPKENVNFIGYKMGDVNDDVDVNK